MDAILAEIALKKQQLKQASSSSAKGAANGSSSKYIKRGELEAQRQREYHKKEEERLRLRKQQQLQKSNSSSSSEVNSSSNLDLSSSSVAAAKDVDTNTSSTTTTTTPNLLSNADIIKRFRSRQQPIRLFGETDAERMVRLAQLESSELAANDESGGGQTNEWRSAVKDTDMEKTLELLYKNKGNYWPSV